MLFEDVELAEKLMSDASILAGYVGSIPEYSGEVLAAEYINKQGNARTIIDGGSHHGEWIRAVNAKFRGATFHCFEPCKLSYDIFTSISNNIIPGQAIITNNSALSTVDGNAIVYSHVPGSSGASLTNRDLSHLGVTEFIEEKVETITLQTYCKLNNITTIDFLKLDIEGWELAVLEHWWKLEDKVKIRYIQIEYGGANIDTRTYLRDFYKLLRSNYNFYRIHPRGLFICNNYKEEYEIFRSVNYLLEFIEN